MALVATVLLSALAATIVLVIATQAINQTKSESNRAAQTTATRLAAETQQAFQVALQNDPYFFLKTVFVAYQLNSGAVVVNPASAPSAPKYTFSEEGRNCSPTATTVQPGSAWSVATCGTAWKYTNLTTAPTAWVELVAPSIHNPLLQVTIMATSGGYSDGLQLAYRLYGPEQFALYTSSEFTSVVGPSAQVVPTSVNGTIYTAGQFNYSGFYVGSQQSSLSLNDSRVDAEQGFTAGGGLPALNRYYIQSPSSGPPVSHQIRRVVPEVLSASALQASVSRSAVVSCPGGTPWWNSTTGSGPVKDATSSSLCLGAGKSVVACTNTACTTTGIVTVPSGAKSYLLIYNNTQSMTYAGATVATPLVDVYYTRGTLNPDAACNASSTCDQVATAIADACSSVDATVTTQCDHENSPLTNPGIMDYWTQSGTSAFLGTLPLPESGIIATDQNTYLGICSQAGPGAGASIASSLATTVPFSQINATCPALDGSASPGMTVPYSSTIIAGTPASPADVFLSSPVTTTNNAAFGVVATSQLVVPYWSHSPGGVQAGTPTEVDWSDPNANLSVLSNASYVVTATGNTTGSTTTCTVALPAQTCNLVGLTNTQTYTTTLGLVMPSGWSTGTSVPINWNDPNVIGESSASYTVTASGTAPGGLAPTVTQTCTASLPATSCNVTGLLANYSYNINVTVTTGGATTTLFDLASSPALASASATSLSLSGAYSALGLNANTQYAAQSSAIDAQNPLGMITFPSNPDTTNPNNNAGVFVINGSYADTGQLNFYLAGFSEEDFNASPLFQKTPPPYFSEFDGMWQNTQVNDFTAAQGCPNTSPTPAVCSAPA